MVHHSAAALDTAFSAVADATRRGVLERLGRGDASITDLATRFDMTLTGMKKHVGVLEQAGLVTTEKVGRVRTCRLGGRTLEAETAWLARYQELWAARFDALDVVVEELKRAEERAALATTTTTTTKEPATSSKQTKKHARSKPRKPRKNALR